MATAEAPLAAVETPVATAVETPAVTTPAAEPTTTPEAPKSDYDVIRQAVAEKLPLDADGQLLKPGSTPKPAEVPPVAAAKTPEELEAERIAAGATETSEQKAAREQQEAAKAAEAKPAEVDPLDKIGPLPAEKLAQVLTEKPELATALEAAGITKDVLFETARQAALTSQFTEVFPTVDAAIFGKENAEHFYNIEDKFTQISDIPTLDDFITNTMVPLSYILGPDGKPQLNPDGVSYKTDGTVARFMKLNTDFEMTQCSGLADQMIEAANKMAEGEAKVAQLDSAQNLKAAIDYINEFRNNGYRMPGPKPATTAELSPEQKAKIEAADRTLQEANQQKQANQQKEVELFNNNVFDDTMKVTNSLISEALNRTSLDDTLKPKAAKEVMEKIGEKLLADKEYQRMNSSYRAKGLTDDTRQKLVALANRTVKGIYGKVLAEVTKEYGATQIAASAARQQKIDTQIKTSNIHPNVASSATAKGPVVLSDQQINDQVMTNAKAAGKEMDIGWIVQERLRLSGKLATA